jgi:hypothetical protein
MSDDEPEAVKLAREHVDADDDNDECNRCHSLFEVDPDNRGTAFCASCMYEVADSVCLAVIALHEENEQLRLMERDMETANAVIIGVRRLLCSRVHCGDGSLVPMVNRALDEATQRGRDEMLDIGEALYAASRAFPPEMEGTIAERVGVIVAERDALRAALGECSELLEEMATQIAADEEDCAHEYPDLDGMQDALAEHRAAMSRVVGRIVEWKKLAEVKP